MLPTLTVQIAFSSNAFDAVPVWDDISSTVQKLSIIRGRMHELNRMESGTSMFTLLNVAGDYWPDNTTGAYTPNVLPAKRISVQATFNAVTYDLYTGFVENWAPGFSLPPIKVPIMTLTCADLIKNLSRLYLNDDTGFASELSGTRVTNVLDDLAWSSTDRDLDTGQSTLMSTGPIVNINAQEHLYNLQDSEAGIVYIAGDGDVQFEDRHHRLKTGHISSEAIFGDDSGEMGYHRINLAYDDLYIYNDIRITRESGLEQVSSSTTSQDAYGKRSLYKTGLIMSTDTDAAGQAGYLNSRFADPFMRCDSIEIHPDNDPTNLYPLVFGLDISDRITIRLNQASIDKDYYIEGIRHDYSPTQSPEWITTWQLTKTDEFVYWLLGVTGYSELEETTRLFY